jgi:hypothetical protein
MVKAGKLAKPHVLPMESSRLVLSEVSIAPKDSAMRFGGEIRVALRDEGGGAYLSLRQNDQEVQIDFDEIPLLVKAAEMLRSPIVGTSLGSSAPELSPACEMLINEHKDFLLSLDLPSLKKAIAGDVIGYGSSLDEAFTWEASPQGHSYWNDICNEGKPFTAEHKAILQSWLDAREALDSQTNSPSIAS